MSNSTTKDLGRSEHDSLQPPAHSRHSRTADMFDACDDDGGNTAGRGVVSVCLQHCTCVRDRGVVFGNCGALLSVRLVRRRFVVTTENQRRAVEAAVRNVLKRLRTTWSSPLAGGRSCAMRRAHKTQNAHRLISTNARGPAVFGLTVAAREHCAEAR